MALSLEQLAEVCAEIEKIASGATHVACVTGEPYRRLHHFAWISTDEDQRKMVPTARSNHRWHLCTRNVGLYPADLKGQLSGEARLIFSHSPLMHQRTIELAYSIDPGRYRCHAFAYRQGGLDVTAGDASSETMAVTLEAHFPAPDDAGDRAVGRLTVMLEEVN